MARKSLAVSHDLNRDGVTFVCDVGEHEKCASGLCLCGCHEVKRGLAEDNGDVPFRYEPPEDEHTQGQ